MTHLLLILFSLIWANVPDSQNVHLVEGSVKSGGLVADDSGSAVHLETEEMVVEIQYPSGKTGHADILMVFDPSTKLFWWEYQTRVGHQGGGFSERFLANSKICETKDKLVSFTFDRPSVWIRESTERRPNLSAARRSVFSTLEEQREKIEAGSTERYKQVNLSQVLPPDFSSLRGNASALPQPKLQHVTRVMDQWRIVLAGPNGDTAIVLLSDQYKLASANVVPASSPK